jgi:uncharacterized membrane protein
MKKKKRQKRRSDFSSSLRTKQYKHHNNEITYWMGLMVILVCVIISSLVLIPVFLVFDTLAYVIVSLMALMFGLLFSFIIHNIPDLELHHHILGTLILVIVAILTVASTVVMTKSLGLSHYSFHPINTGFVYGGMFLLPYIVHHSYLS